MQRHFPLEGGIGRCSPFELINGFVEVAVLLAGGELGLIDLADELSLLETIQQRFPELVEPSIQNGVGIVPKFDFLPLGRLSLRKSRQCIEAALKLANEPFSLLTTTPLIQEGGWRNRSLIRGRRRTRCFFFGSRRGGSRSGYSGGVPALFVPLVLPRELACAWLAFRHPRLTLCGRHFGGRFGGSRRLGDDQRGSGQCLFARRTTKKGG